MFLLPNKWRINRLRKLLYSMLEISPSIIAEFVNYFSLSHLVFLLPHPQRSGNMQKSRSERREGERKRIEDKLHMITLVRQRGKKVISVGTKGKYLQPGYDIP